MQGRRVCVTNSYTRIAYNRRLYSLMTVSALKQKSFKRFIIVAAAL